IGVAMSRSAAATWSPAARSSPQRSRASATRASITPGLARAREVELALDREVGFLAVVPVVERVLLERVLLLAGRRPRRLFLDLVDMDAVVRDDDGVGHLADLRPEDRVVRLLVELILRDPPQLAALCRVLGVGEVARERRPVGAAFGF